jgi:hypothetical protein
MQGRGIKKTERQKREVFIGCYAVAEEHIPCQILTISRQSCYPQLKDKGTRSESV